MVFPKQVMMTGCFAYLLLAIAWNELHLNYKHHEWKFQKTFICNTFIQVWKRFMFTHSVQLFWSHCAYVLLTAEEYFAFLCIAVGRTNNISFEAQTIREWKFQKKTFRVHTFFANHWYLLSSFFFFIFDPADRKDVLSDRNVFFLNTDIVLKQGLIVFCWW